MYFIPFVYQLTLFSFLNAAGSLHAWHLTRRRMMLFTGSFNTSIGAIAACAYSFDATLSNAYASIASLCASAQFILHGLRTRALQQPTVFVGVYYFWCISLLIFGLHRGRWAYILRYD